MWRPRAAGRTIGLLDRARDGGTGCGGDNPLTMPDEWIGFLLFDPGTAAKIRDKHQLTEDQIREAVLFGHAEHARYREDTPYGPRLEVIGTAADGTRLKAWLEPADRTDGIWRCKTAWKLT